MEVREPDFTNLKGTITLCGSTRFYDYFKLAGLKLTLNDWHVFSIGIDTKSDVDIKSAGEFNIDHDRLDTLHKSKIAKSEAIMVIDINRYVGESTRAEIAYALKHGKKIYSYSLSAEKDKFDEPIEMPQPLLETIMGGKQ